MSTTRDDLIAGLRALADFYEANPTMPLPVYPDLLDTGEPGASDAEDVERIQRQAALLGVEVETRASGHKYAVRQFAGLTFRAAHSPSRAMAAHNALQSYAGSVQSERSAL